MLIRDRVETALAESRDRFHQIQGEAQDLVDRYRAALRELSGISRSDVENRLGGVEWPGARPTRDLDRSGLIDRFPLRWNSAEEARAWALERIRGVPTAAVDGSQIVASKEFGVPVSLVQVGWFANFHDPELPYRKDIRDEILVPEPGEREIEDYIFAESRVNRRRFALEMEVAGELVRDLGESDVPPVVFLDGTFVLSFAGRIQPEARAVYLEALFRLLDVSAACRVPAIGYVDLSYASDLTTMLRTAFDLPSGNVFDAHILDGEMEYFDRTAAFRCARSDVLPLYKSAERDRSGDLFFVYLKPGAGPPARIDFPAWVLEEGLLDHVLDVVRAEIVVAGGYPYPLETADATAVLTTEDRLAFYRLFEEFAQESGLQGPMPSKALSKRRRR